MPVVIKQTTESLLSEIGFNCPEVFVGKEGFAFYAFECAVFENEVNRNRYEYTAYNVHSGKSELIYRRRTPLKRTNEDIERILRNLKATKIAGRGRIEIDSDKALQVERIREVMYEVFREILPRYGYVVRDAQIELADKLLDAIRNRGTLLAEAAVGIGKTLAYIIVAALVKRSRLNEHWNTAYFPEMSVVEWKRMPVVVSTASIALQRAIEKDTIPEISKILLENGVIKKPLKAVLVKGKSHYVCEYSLQAHLPFEKKTDIRMVLEQITCNRERIDLAEIEGLTAHVKKKICVPNKCFKNCPYSDDCRYKDYRVNVKNGETDFLITNHNLFLADAKLRAGGNKPILPPYQMVVFDEAHEVLQAARSIYGLEFMADTVPDISRSVLELDFTPLTTESSDDWRDIRDTIHQIADKFYGQNRRMFAKTDAGAECDRHMNLISNFAGELHYNIEKTYQFKNKRDEKRKNTILSALEQLSELVTPMASNGGNIRWFETNGTDHISLCSLPKNLNDILFSDLWKRGVPSLLTSGTLSVGGDFSALKHSVGLSGMKRITETTQSSPYDYNRNCRLYIPKRIPFPHQSNKEYLSALTDEIERLILVSHGHAAVLFTSYYVMGAVFNEIEKRIHQFPLFKLERSTSSAIERFKQSGNGVLFASGSLWQGIDIPGDLLSMLIIAKLPFPQPNAISEFERTLYPDFNSYLKAVIIPEMLIMLKQGFGRLLRSLTDTGIVAILDSRIGIFGKYRQCVLDALPHCPMTDDIIELGNFLRSIKPLEYWM